MHSIPKNPDLSWTGWFFLSLAALFPFGYYASEHHSAVIIIQPGNRMAILFF
jgi:hypothetical protein